MFFLVGVIYDRAHHRDLNNFRGLYEPMPLYGGISAVIFFAAMGLPGHLIGQDVIPETYHPIADLLPEPRLREFLDGLEQSHVGEVSRWAEHGAFVAKFAPVNRELVPA